MALRLLASSSLLSSQGLAIRAIATYAIKSPLSAAAVLQGHDQYAVSQREATAMVARRQQWNTHPIDAPRSLQAVVQDRNSTQARIVTEAAYPYHVVFANRAWEQLCGWTAEEAVGKSGLGFMQGEATDKTAVRRINSAVREGERISLHVVNYKRDGTPFLNHLQITPLRSGLGEYTHMLGILNEVPMGEH